jgi:hypothetical protein
MWNPYGKKCETQMLDVSLSIYAYLSVITRIFFYSCPMLNANVRRVLTLRNCLQHSFHIL